MGLNIMCGGGQKVLINDELGEAQEYDIWKSMPIQPGFRFTGDFAWTCMMNGKAYYFPMYTDQVIEFDGEKSVNKNWSVYGNKGLNTITVLGNDIYYIDGNEIKKYIPGYGGVTYAACPSSESYIKQIIAFNGKIYAFCQTRPSDDRYHTIQYYDESNSEWVLAEHLTNASEYNYHYYPGYSSLIVFDNKIHVLGGGISSSYYKEHYSFDGTDFRGDVTAPFDIAHGQASVYDGKIHLIGAYGGPNKEYTFNGTTWATETVFSVNGENSINDFAQTACLAKIAGKEFIIGLGQRFNIEKKPDLFICSYYNP